MKRRSLCLLLSLLLLLCTGCMDYRGADQILPVTAIMVDLGDDEKTLKLTFQVLDSAANDVGAPEKTMLIASEGVSVDEAVFNANQILPRDLYFGNAELLVIGHQVCETLGLSPVLENFLRNYGIRNTLLVIVSHDESALAVLQPTIEDNTIASYAIADNLDWHNHSNKSASTLQLYEVYNDLLRDTENLTLPSYRYSYELTPQQPVSDRLAVFDKDKLVGYLSDSQSRYSLLANYYVQDDFFTFGLDGEEAKTVNIDIVHSKPEKRFAFDGARFTFQIQLDVLMDIHSVRPEVGTINQALIRTIETQAADVLTERIRAVITELQAEAFDVLGLSTTVYRTDPKLWDAVKSDWKSYFQNAQVEVRVKLQNRASGIISQY